MKVVLSVLLLAAVASAEQPAAVTRVVNLLTELQGRIESDAASEQSAYDKFACWCEEMTQKKAAAIESVREEIRRVGNQILQLKGTVATTVAEIVGLVTDIKKNEESQKEATAIRQKQNAEFVAEKAELEQAIAALEKAVVVLRDATGPSLLRKAVTTTGKTSRRVVSALEIVHAVVNALPAHVRPEPKQLVALTAAVSSHGKHTYTPQSSTIQGILTDMYHTFVGTLETSTQAEATAHRNYEDLMATWAKELATLQATLAKKEQLKTESETMLADATQSFSDAEAQLKSDVKFFDATKASCQSKSEDWSARKTLRTEELDGISKALQILSSDSAKELFSTAIKPGFETFLQLDVTKRGRGGPVLQACRVLQGLARKGQSIRLAALAAKLRTSAHAGHVGHFDEVIGAIDKIIQELLTETQADEKKQTECKDQFQSLHSSQADLEWKIKNNEAKIQKLEQVIEAKDAEKTQTLSAIDDVTREIQDMESQRGEENEEFTHAKEDDEKAIDLLEEAKTALAKYHAEHGSLEPAKLFLQRNEPNATAPEAKFSKKDNREVESKGIVSILTMIIEDLRSEISNGVKAEEAAQLDFEKRLAAAKTLESDLTTKKANLDEVIATKEAALDSTKTTKTDNEKLLATDQETETAMKPDCDSMIANIGTRRNKRDTEIAGLREAKALLAGMDQASMVEISRKFDDGLFPSIAFQQLS